MDFNSHWFVQRTNDSLQLSFCASRTILTCQMSYYIIDILVVKDQMH